VKGGGAEVKFQDFEPDLFWAIRESFKISHSGYLDSLKSTAKERFGDGASGAFMYFSKDERYIVKTATKDEFFNSLLTLVPAYANYVRRWPDTLICRFLGAYSIQILQKTLYFYVMENVFGYMPRVGVSMDIYDLKGSWVSRNGKESAQLRGQKKVCKNCNANFVVGSPELCPEMPNRTHRPRAVMKDNDLLYKLRLAPDHASQIAEQLYRDCTFLRSFGLMDYSLLLGVVRQRIAKPAGVSPFGPSGDEQWAKEDGEKRPFFQSYFGGMSAVEVEGPGIYYLGIVDILQKWDYKKYLEHFVKVVFMCRSASGLSAISPEHYARRFKKRVVDRVIGGAIAARGGGDISDDSHDGFGTRAGSPPLGNSPDWVGLEMSVLGESVRGGDSSLNEPFGRSSSSPISPRY
jgi:1-phosphatidylinositol-4-phosphate 5-kinase